MNKRTSRAAFLRKDLQNRVNRNFGSAVGVSATAALLMPLPSGDAAVADTPTACKSQ